LKSGGPTDLNVGAGLQLVLLESRAQFNDPMICEPSLTIIVVNFFAQFEPLLLFVAQEVAAFASASSARYCKSCLTQPQRPRPQYENWQ
jgi:hypothetical protein